MPELAVATVVAKNYVSFARVLAESFLRQHPDIPFFALLSDEVHGHFDPAAEPFRTLVKKLVDRHVALTSTLTVFETFTPGRPMPPGTQVLLPQLKEQFDATFQRVSQNQQSIYKTLLPKGMALERAFAKAGGLLVAGTDPTGSGGVIPGFSDERPHASTVPSTAGFCSSAEPSGTQSPRALSMACRSSRHRSW